MRYNVSPPKNKKFYNFPILNRLNVKERLSIPTDNGVVVARWSLLIHSRNTAKSANHKLLTEILHCIEKLI